MNLYEYQAKELFRKYGIPVPNGKFAASTSDIQWEKFPVVIKAQVLVGGRGKAGGIKFAEDKKDLQAKAAEILSMSIKGLKVRSVYLEEKLDIAKEYYVSITLDRSKRKPIIMATTEGGVEIEDVPDDKIVKYWTDPVIGYSAFIGKEISFKLKLPDQEAKQFQVILSRMYDLYNDYDAELVEINPLVVTRSGTIIAGDAKVIVDSDSLFRHKDLGENAAERSELEEIAYKRGYSLVELDGNIGVIANGAGLTMGTLDGLTLKGGKPRNFLDLGGSDDVEKVVGAFEILKMANPKGILINIFGGVTHCDTVANGIIEARKRVGIDVPIVTRLSGVNEDLGKKILEGNGINSYGDMMDAIEEIVKVVNKQ